MKPLLSAHGLFVQRGSRPVLRGIDFALYPGEFVALVGPNGAGKTTLLETLAGVLAPSCGEVMLGGVSFAELGSRERAQQVALLGRELPGQLPLSARAVVELGRLPHLRGWGLSQSDKQIVDESLEETDCAHLTARPVSSLSDGERQRVHFARALCQRPRILLLDEATAHLDLSHREQSFSRAHRFAESGGGVVAIAHDLDLALRHASRVVVLRNGGVYLDAPGPTALNSKTFADVFSIDAEVVTTGRGRSIAIYGSLS
jgi:iron complex transport system ATP-binding protein